MTIYGVDVSYFQDGMSLAQAKAEGFDFAFIRTTDGTFRDPCYLSHLQDAEAAGMVTAAYHFLRRPDEGSSVQDQVNASLAVMGDARRPVWLDVETPGGIGADVIRAAAAAYRAAGVRVAGAYSYVPYWEGQISPSEPDSHEFGAFWVAAYPTIQTGAASAIYDALGGDGNAQWNHPLGNQLPSVWQFTDRATVAGHTVDADAFRGTPAELHDLIYGAAEAPTDREDTDMTPEQESKIDRLIDLVEDVRLQQGSGDNYSGFPQGGHRTLYDLAAATAEKVGVPATRDAKGQR